MPAKRTRAKAKTHRITPEAVAAFKVAQNYADIYHACVGGQPCRSNHPSRHCTECRAYLSARNELDSLLGLRPWETSPLDAAEAESPYPPGTGGAISFGQAKGLRAKLEAALAGHQRLP